MNITGEVLICHRNEQLYVVLRRLIQLKLPGLKVEHAPSERDASRRLSDPRAGAPVRPPDVLLVDVSGPAETRWAPLQRAFRLGPRKPYCLAFSHAQQDENRARLEGADRFLLTFGAQRGRDLSAVIVEEIEQAMRLRRDWVPLSPAPALPALDEACGQWVEQLHSKSLGEVPSPPAEMAASLGAALAAESQARLTDRRRPACYVVRPDLPGAWPWELLLDRPDVSMVRLFAGQLPDGAAAPDQARPFSRRRLRAVYACANVDFTVEGSELDPIDDDRRRSALVMLVRSLGGRLDSVDATLEEIGTCCDKEPVDLLHLACHGEERDGEGVLVLYDEDDQYGRGRYVLGRELARRLRGNPPSVVVLEACCAGLGPSGVAAQLLGVGVRAVVCAQVKLGHELTDRIIPTFYEALGLSGLRLDRAVSACRDERVEGVPLARIAMTLAVAEEAGLDALCAFATPFDASELL